MAAKLSQPGCHTNTGTSAQTGRSVVKLEIPPGSNLDWRREFGKASSIPLMRGAVRKTEKKTKKGKQFLGRQASFLQFSSKPVKCRWFNNTREGIQLALRRFETLRLYHASKSSSHAAMLAFKDIKDRQPYLLVNKAHNRENDVPGVEVGDRFSWRAELSLVGLHNKLQHGIDWKDIILCGDKVSIALCVVVSGGYEDDFDEGDTLIYTGEGGNDLNRTKRQFEDQKMEGGNMALHNSRILKKSVRVIRGRPDSSSPSGTVYTYDGLYKVVDCREESGISNFKVFKFRLERESNQIPLSWHPPAANLRGSQHTGWQARG